MAKKILVEDVAPLVEEYKGNVSAIARKLGVARGTVYNRIEESKTLQQALVDARQTMVDNAESALYKAVLDGNMTAIIFFLKTQGKDRGYTERFEQRVENLNIDLSQCTNEQLERIANGEDLRSIFAATGGGGTGAAAADE